MSESIDYLSPLSIRTQCQKIYQLTQEGKTHFQLNLDRLPPLAERWHQLTQERYGQGPIPPHSRWEHFLHGNPKRMDFLPIKEGDRERLMSAIDLTIISVFLDAGAGPHWKYTVESENRQYFRSEGLALATLEMFRGGLFSPDPERPHQVTAQKLQSLTQTDWEQAFQVSPKNPLLGIEGRIELMNNLAQTLKDSANSNFFHHGGTDRPANLIYYWQSKFEMKPFQANEILKTLLTAFSGLWPEKYRDSTGVNLFDIWDHSLLTPEKIPFHKLSQWLSYSLLDLLQRWSIPTEGWDQLTGLAEYRNGGLFMDAELITLKDKALGEKKLPPNHPVIVEWRALTICLLDQLTQFVRDKYPLAGTNWTLAQVLEGGTWELGRRYAKERRDDGGPPLAIESAGNLF